MALKGKNKRTKIDFMNLLGIGQIERDKTFLVGSIPTKANTIMKIHEKPTTTHNKLLNKKHKHISKTNNGYVIRITRHGTTYYYGEYTTLQQALQTEYKLQLRNYPTELCQKNTTKKGEKYKKWLQQELQKE